VKLNLEQSLPSVIFHPSKVKKLLDVFFLVEGGKKEMEKSHTERQLCHQRLKTKKIICNMPNHITGLLTVLEEEQPAKDRALLSEQHTRLAQGRIFSVWGAGGKHVDIFN